MITVREALPEDGESLQAMQERCSIGTDLVLSPVNVPGFFDRVQVYADCKTFIAYGGDEIAGSASCAVRSLLVGGRELKVGYEFQYITNPDYQRRGIASRLTKRIEKYLLEKGASISYCMIMENNIPSMRLAEQHGFSLHRTLTMSVGFINRPMPTQESERVRQAETKDLSAIANLINETWTGYDFYEPMSKEGLEALIARTTGYAIENIYVLEKNDRIIACLGYWDLSCVMQVKVRALSPKLHAMRLLFGLVNQFKPVPYIPGPGESLKQYFLSLIGFSDPEHLRELLFRVNNIALSKGAKQLFCICEPNHPLISGMGNLWCENISVRFYAKRLKPEIELLDRPVFVDNIDL